MKLTLSSGSAGIMTIGRRRDCERHLKEPFGLPVLPGRTAGTARRSP